MIESRWYRRSLTLFILLTLLVAPTALFAIGAPPYHASARALGMGGALLATGNSPLTANGNPAILATFRKPLVDVTLDQNRLDSRVKSSYSISDDYTPGEIQFRSGSLLVPMNLASHNVSLAVGYERQAHINSTWIEGDVINSGSLHYLNGSFAIQLPKGGSVGITLQQLGGEYTYNFEEITPEYPYGTGNTLTFTETYDGLSFRLGYLVDFQQAGVDIPLTLGMVVRPGSVYKREIHQPGFSPYSYDTDLPWLVGAGIAWNPIPKVLVAADIERTMYAGGEVKINRPIFGNLSFPLTEHNKDVNGYRVGVEYTSVHETLTLMPRLGLNYLPSYNADLLSTGSDTDESNTSPAYTFGKSIGVGIQIGNVRLDVAYETASWSYKHEYHLGNPITDLTVSKTTYSGTSEQFLAGLSFLF